MTFELFDFQDECVASLVRRVNAARDEHLDEGTLHAVGLVAPTAAGKTVMASDFLARIFDERPETVVVWMSDQPALNEQSMAKMQIARPSLERKGRITRLGEHDQRILDGGRVYFANVQMFGKGATSNHAAVNGVSNDARTYGVWDMIANTINVKGADFILMIDEAHRGVGTKSDRAAKTILNTLIHGGNRVIGGRQPATPIVVGISATPERFENSVKNAETDRAIRLVKADVTKVRASGLLKERIVISKPSEDQDADMTLVADAVRRLGEVTDMWAEHHHTTGDPLVEPVMVVQVKPGITPRDIAAIIDTIGDVNPALTPDKIAHSFDTRAPIDKIPSKNGDVKIRYLAPDDINDDDSVRVVLFKTALTTGWDCPRAEVMVSLRGSADPTNIAQLIGRMVRTPLAKKIEEGDEDLNSVTLSLPFYDSREVANVVTALTADAASPADTSLYPVKVERNQHVPESLFDLLGSLPSDKRAKATFPTVTARARRLAGLLATHFDGLRPNEALDHALLSAMQAQYNPSTADQIDATVADILTLDMSGSVVVNVGEDDYTEADNPRSLRTLSYDIEKAATKAMRALPDNAGHLYYDHLILTEGLDDEEASARVIAMSRIPSVKEAVESAAETKIASWRDDYEAKVRVLTDPDAATAIRELWNPTHVPTVAGTVDVPTTASVPSARVIDEATGADIINLPLFGKHLLSLPGTDEFPFKAGSSWETDVLTVALATPGLVGWYRNPSSGKHALAIGYESQGKSALLHPDFLFFRTSGDRTVVDIIDPHMHSSADTSAKWVALADYATVVDEMQPGLLGNVYAVIKPTGSDSLRAVDLRDRSVRDALSEVSTKDGVEAVFTEHGFNYA